MTSTLLRGATVISMDDTIGILVGADILIQDDRIAKVGVALPDSADTVIDAAGMIAIPGLVNAHIHLWQTAMRGLGGDWAGTDYYRYVHATFGPAYEPEDSRASERLGALNQINNGTTTVFDWCHNNRTPEHSDASIEGLAQSGIRALFGHGTVKSATPPGQPHYSQVPHPRAEALRLRDRLDDGGLISLSLCILGPDYSTIEVTRQDLQLARELGLHSSAHVWGKANRLVPSGYRPLVAEGLVDATHNVAHGNYFEDDEIRMLLDAGASITSGPPGEVMGTDREPLVRRIRELGGRPSIGNDSELGMTGEMLEIARRSLAIHRLFDNLSLAAAGAASQDKFLGAVGHDGGAVQDNYRATALDALRWATLDNAAALGLEDSIGSITPGKKADLVLLDSGHPGMAPAHDPVDAVVNYGHSGMIDTVFVDGVLRKSGGRLVDQAGLATAIQDARAAGARVLERTGVTAPSLS